MKKVLVKVKNKKNTINFSKLMVWICLIVKRLMRLPIPIDRRADHLEIWRESGEIGDFAALN